MSAARALARAQAAGVRLRLRPDGTVKLEADAPPPAELLTELRQWRHQIADLLAGQGRRSGFGASFPDVPAAPDPDLAAELAVMAQHYAAEPSAQPYLPSSPDQLRDGLLLGFRRHSARLAARAGASNPAAEETR